jgi:hypothetical protein
VWNREFAKPLLAIPDGWLELCTQTREWKPTLLRCICEGEPILVLWNSSLVAGFPLSAPRSCDASFKHGPNFGPMMNKLFSFFRLECRN